MSSKNRLLIRKMSQFYVKSEELDLGQKSSKDQESVKNERSNQRLESQLIDTSQFKQPKVESNLRGYQYLEFKKSQIFIQGNGSQLGQSNLRHQNDDNDWQIHWICFDENEFEGIEMTESTREAFSQKKVNDQIQQVIQQAEFNEFPVKRFSRLLEDNESLISEHSIWK